MRFGDPDEFGGFALSGERGLGGGGEGGGADEGVGRGGHCGGVDVVMEKWKAGDFGLRVLSLGLMRVWLTFGAGEGEGVWVVMSTSGRRRVTIWCYILLNSQSTCS